MPELFTKRWNRKVTAAVVATLLIILYALAYWVIPSLDPSSHNSALQALSAVIRDVAATLVATTILGALILFLTPPVMEIAKITPIEPKEIRGLLDAAVIQSNIWYFKGGLGRDFRTRTLATLDRVARQTTRARVVIALIIDPTNADACTSYARYRNAFSASNMWTAGMVSVELYATILTIAEYAGKNPLLDLRIGLTASWSTFRIDLSSQYAIVTRADVNDVGLRCDVGSSFYEAYQTEVQIAFDQAQKLTLPNRHFSRTMEDAQALFRDLGVEGESMSPTKISDIVTAALRDTSPYGK